MSKNQLAQSEILKAVEEVGVVGICTLAILHPKHSDHLQESLSVALKILKPIPRVVFQKAVEVAWEVEQLSLIHI